MDIRRNWYVLVIGAIVILVGAYFLFQHKSTTDFRSELPASLASSTILGADKNIIVSTPNGVSGGFGIVFDTTNLNLKIGAFLPTVKVNLPPNSNGKVVVFALQPALATSTIAYDILFAYTLNTNATSTQFSGIRLSQYIDGKTGTEHLPIQPGTYKLEAVLWNRNPFYTNKTYGDFANGNNATAVLSGVFTISP